MQKNQGYLPITRKNRKFRFINLKARAFRLGSYRKYEPSFEVMQASPHHVKFYSFMFVLKFFIRVICVNGKHPSIPWHRWAKRGNIQLFPACRMTEKANKKHGCPTFFQVLCST